MATTVHDDYLICREYQEQIDKKSAEYPGFITFQHENGNHYFAWVDGDQIILRSEAYPDAEKMERGIKAVIKNRDINERYSTEEAHGAHFLVLWGGGDHQKHTGNMESHNEIGRSCPHKTGAELKALLARYNSSLTSGINFGEAASTVAAAAATVAPAAMAAAAEPVRETHTASTRTASTNTTSTSSSSYSDEDSGGGMGWLKWLLPLLLLGGLAWFLTKGGCNKAGDTAAAVVDTLEAKVDTLVAALPKVTVDTVTGVVTYDLGAMGDIDLPNGTKIIGAAANGFERTLLNFIQTGAIDTIDKTKNWFNLHDVQFKTGSTEYATERAMAQLTNVAATLKAYPNVMLKLGGYTDVRGGEAPNLKLSQARADRVLKDLGKMGVGKQIKEAVGYGEKFATAAEGDVEGMARDRKTAAKVASK